MSLSIFDAALQVPDDAFLVGDGLCLSFAEAAIEARRALAWLARCGVHPSTSVNDSVALVADGQPRSLTMLLALISGGIPALLLHPRWTPTERARWLERCPHRLLIEPRALAESAALEPISADEIARVADDERPLAILATSGSSGLPKGVVLSRRAFVAAARASERNLGFFAGDRWLLNLPLSHVGGLSIVTRCLLARRTVVVAEPSSDGPELRANIETQKVTLMSLVPAQLHRLLTAASNAKAPPSLRAVLVGGAAVSPELSSRAVACGWPVLATYGLTEACSQVATVRYGSRDPAREGCGAPLESIEVRIVDGAIQVRGPTLFSSYLPDTGRPLLEGGWFETEDLGEIDEAGRLWVHGRRDELIVTGGENVHPRELESVLERHPAIERACAFGIPDETWGQLVAVALVCEPARRPSIAEIRGFVESALAAFKRPRRVAFLNELAESPTGKLDRRQIAELARKTLIPIE